MGAGLELHGTGLAASELSSVASADPAQARVQEAEVLLRIYLFGSFKVEHRGRIVTPEEWGRPKDRALLKRLALSPGHVVPQDRLLDDLWPDLTPEAATNSLHVAVSRLRKLFGGGVPIRREGAGYLLDLTESVLIDLEEFRRLLGRGRERRREAGAAAAIDAFRAASALYRGDLCEDDPYAEWTIHPREELRQAYLSLLEELADCLVQVRATAEAVEVCERGLSRDRTREGLYVQLMRSHLAAGRVAEGLQVYERCRRALAEELGVDPGPAARALHAQLLRDDEQSDAASLQHPPMERAAPVIAARDHPGGAHLACVGRERELASLAEGFAAAQEGHGQFVLLHGEPGIGKSRLLEEVGHAAESHRLGVLAARCYELERDLPYAPIVDTLDRYLSDQLDPVEVTAALGEWAPQLAALIPRLRELLPHLPRPQPLRPDAERSALLAGLRHLLLMLGKQQPLVLLLDDLQWADASTIQLLQYLSSRLNGMALLIVGAYRTGEVGPDHPLQVIVERASTDPRWLIELPCLTVDDVVALLPSVAAVAERLHRETDGHPLFLVETLRTLIETGVLHLNERGEWAEASGSLPSSGARLPFPPNLREAIRWRFRRLNERERRVLMAAAVAARGFRADLLATMTELNLDIVLDALEALVGRQLLRLSPAGSGFDFRHDLIQEVVYADLSPDRRRTFHSRAAEAFEVWAAEQHVPESELAAELAHHWRQAECWAPALRFAILAGDRARRSFAPREALTNYRRAMEIAERQPGLLEPAERIGLVERLGRAHAEVGEPDAALRHFEILRELARSRNDRLLEGRALAAVADAHYWRHDFSRAEEFAAQALAVADELDDNGLRAGGLVTSASVAMARGRTEAAEQNCNAVLDLAGDRPPAQGGESPAVAGARLNALGWLGLMHEFQCDHQRAIPAIDASLQLGIELHNPFLTGRSRFALGMSLGNRGAYEDALSTLREAFRLAEEGGDRYFLPRLPNTIGWIYSELGDLEQAAEWNRRSVALARETGWLEAEANALVNLGGDALWSGDRSQAREYFSNAAALIDRDEWFTWRYRMRLLIGLGELALEDGSPEQAVALAGQALELAEPTVSRKHAGRACLLRGRAMLAAGAPLAEVLAQLEHSRLLAHVSSHPRLIWSAAFELARVHARLHDEAEAANYQAEARTAIESVANGIRDPTHQRAFLRCDSVQRVLGDIVSISR